MKEYILKNKNEEIIRFQVNSFTDGKTLQQIKEIKILKKNEKLFPIQFQNSKNLEETLARFISSRKVPRNRSFAKKIMQETGNDDLMGYIDISFGLSLNDTLWIVPNEKEKLKWEKVNLYKNPFSERLQMASFGLGYDGDSAYKISPEFTTNGMLKKCWIKEDNEIYLLKKNSEKGFDRNTQHLEVFSEYYISQIAKLFKKNSIEYDIVDFKEQFCSKCKLFTNEKQGYTPIMAFLSEDELRQGEKILSDRTHFINKAIEIYGKENYEDLMLFDSITGNRDRHLGNFGMLVDNQTFEVIKPAPIFNNGESVLNYYNFSKNLDFRMYASRTNSLGQRFADVFKTYADKRHQNFFEKLKNFKFEKHPYYNLPNEILKSFENHLKVMAERGLKLIEKKENKDFKSNKNGKIR